MTALESKPFVAGLTTIAALIILLAYASAKPAIDRAAPTLLWAGLGIIGVMVFFGGISFAIIQIEKLRTLRSQMSAARSIAQSEADKVHNEAIAPLVITAQEGEQVIVRDMDFGSTYRKVTESLQTHVNGHSQEPTPLEVQLFMMRNGGSGYAGQRDTGQRDTGQLVIDSQSVMGGEIHPVNILDRYKSDWIEAIVLPSPHIHYCGATTSGKTRLANYHISKIAKQDPDAKIYLINPKHVESINSFIVEPNFKGIDNALDGLNAFNSILESRVADKDFSQTDSNRIIFIIDEWDWIFHRYGAEAVAAFEPLVKTGAAIKVNIILIGQSPLTGDTGLSQSFYNNMARVAIWKEGGKLLNNYPLERKYKAPLQAQYEELKLLASQTDTESNKLRYCVVAPMSGNPSVQVIPHLEDPVNIGAPKPVEMTRPIAGSYDEQVCRAWYQTARSKAPSGNKMHQILTSEDARINGRHKQDYLKILRKYNINPGFLMRIK